MNYDERRAEELLALLPERIRESMRIQAEEQDDPMEFLERIVDLSRAVEAAKERASAARGMVEER